MIQNRKLRTLVMTSIIITFMTPNSTNGHPLLVRAGELVAVWGATKLLDYTYSILVNDKKDNRIISRREHKELKKLHELYSLHNQYRQAVDKYSSGKILISESNSKSDISSGFQDLINAWNITKHGSHRAKSLKHFPWEILLIKIGRTLRFAIKTRRPGQYKRTMKEIDMELYRIMRWWSKQQIYKKFKHKIGSDKSYYLYRTPFGDKAFTIKSESEGIVFINRSRIWTLTFHLAKKRSVVYKKYRSMQALGRQIRAEDRHLALSRKIRKEIVSMIANEYSRNFLLKTWPSGLNREILHKRENRKHGAYISWYANGRKKEKGEYDNDRKSGVWKEWYHNGKIKSFGSYKNGKKNGKWTWFFFTGQKKYVAEYKNGQLHGMETSWLWPNGKWTIKSSYKNGKLNGRFIRRNYFGEIIEFKRYKEGRIWYHKLYFQARHPNKEHFEKHWYMNGKPQIFKRYQRRKRHNKWLEWYENGKLKSSHVYKDSSKHGKQLEWYPNGKLKHTCEYLRNQKHGKCIYFRESGQAYKLEEYSSGSRSGTWITKNKSGNIETEEIYSKGRLTNRLLYQCKKEKCKVTLSVWDYFTKKMVLTKSLEFKKK